MAVLQEVLCMTNQLPNARKEFFEKIVKTTCVTIYDKANTYQMRAKNFLKKIVKTTCVTTNIN